MTDVRNQISSIKGALMDPVKFTCRCQNASSKWLEMAPTDMHNYRVECGSCGKFIKWGSKDELEHRVKVYDKITVIPYEDRVQEPRRTIDDFLA